MLSKRLSRGRWVIVAALGAAMACMLASSADAQDGKDRRMLRQIGVMEKILDQVLIESPNFLVPGRNNTRGIYLDGFGMLLTFEASLVDKDHDFDVDWRLGYRIEENEAGEKVIVIPKWSKEKEENPTSQRQGRQARLYDRGKTEIRDVLLDYADTLTGLGDNDWIAVAAYLRESDFFVNERISRLVIKVRVRDIRAYAAGKIDEEQALARFEEEEY